MLSTLPITARAAFQLFVRFHPGAISFPSQDGGNGSSFTALLEDAVFLDPHLAEVFADLGARFFTTVAPSWRHLTGPVPNHRGEMVDLVDFTDLYLVTFAGSDPAHATTILSDTPSLTYAYTPQTYIPGSFPDDPLFPQQWNLDNTGQIYEGEPCEVNLDVNAPEAWAITQGSGTKIGVVDMGVSLEHPDVSPYIDWNLSYAFDDPPWWLDRNHHGTKVAGVALAGGHNGIGIASLANTPAQGNLPIVALKVGHSQPQDAAVIAALDYITTVPQYPQILVTNHSWYGPRCFHGTNPYWRYSPALRDAFRNCYLLDLSTFACAGNVQGGCPPIRPDGGCNLTRCWMFPAAFSDYCFGVRGITCSGQDPGIQGRGHWVDGTAPSRLTATNATGGYVVFGQCSAATPGAASVAGLLLRRNPDLTNEDIYNVLRLTASDLGVPGYDEAYGAGLIRADSAVLVLSPPVVLFHRAAQGYTSSYVESRPQWFKNLTGLTVEEERWEGFFASVHKLHIGADFPDNGPIFDPILGVWGRGRGSAGVRNDDSLDVRLWAADLKVDPASVSPTGCILETYTYEIYDPDQVTFRCWYPVALDLRPVCTPFPSTPDFLYSYLADTSSTNGFEADHPRPEAAKLIREDAIDRWNGRADPAHVEVFDVGGRLLRVLVDESGSASGSRALEWDGKDALGRRVPSGIYLMVSRDRHQRATRKVLFIE